MKVLAGEVGADDEAYFSGVQTNFFTDTITFNDGTSQTIDIPGTGTTGSIGAAAFVGFTDAGKLITSVTINAGNPGTQSPGIDDIGVDDVRFQVPPVPEPSSLALLTLGGVALAGWRRWKKRSPWHDQAFLRIAPEAIAAPGSSPGGCFRCGKSINKARVTS